MEQHPVPQNVTTFQFRLIGDMTLKQFGYLCAGGILAFIAYKLPLPFFFTWPLAFALAFLGVGFAFIPIEERPMDVWVFSFFKSIYNPTQYVWMKTDKTASAAQKTTPPVPVPQPLKQPVVSAATSHTPPVSALPSVPAVAAPAAKPHTAVLSDLFGKTAAPAPQKPAPVVPHVPSTPVPATKPFSFMAWIRSLFAFAPRPASQPQPAKQPAAPAPPPAPPQGVTYVPLHDVTGNKPEETTPQTQQPSAPPRSAAEDPETIAKMATLETALKNLQTQLSEKDIASDRVLELQRQLTKLLQQRTSMEEELITLRRQLETTQAAKQQHVPIPVPASSPPPDAGPAGKSTVTVINTQGDAVKAGLPKLTSVANVITGIVKDTDANLLPGILVTVTNSEGIPVRALKTNKLGQFGASTPLGSGTYFVEIEDPRKRYSFSRVQITLSGAVVPALEIIAKSHKELTREKLTAEIFGNNSI